MYEEKVRQLLSEIIDDEDNVILVDGPIRQVISVGDIAERFGDAWEAEDVYTALKTHPKAVGLWQSIIEDWHNRGLI